MQEAEVEAHLGREAEQASGNHRNGHNRKRVLTDDGRLDLEGVAGPPGALRATLGGEHARRLPGLDDKVISRYARGMTTREIRTHVAKLYGVTVSGGTGLEGPRCSVGQGRGVAVTPVGGGVRDRCASTR